jgi:hypothetical protein
LPSDRGRWHTGIHHLHEASQPKFHRGFLQEGPSLTGLCFNQGRTIFLACLRSVIAGGIFMGVKRSLAVVIGLALAMVAADLAIAHHEWSGYDSEQVLNLTEAIQESG